MGGSGLMTNQIAKDRSNFTIESGEAATTKISNASTGQVYGGKYKT
jgi:hypothetical protein